MRFLKLGNRYINAEQITHVFWDENDKLAVWFNGRRTFFKGKEAAALIAWLDQRADAVYPLPEVDVNE